MTTGLMSDREGSPALAAPGGSARSVARTWARALQNCQKLDEAPQATLASVVAMVAATYGDRPALIDTREELTYRGLVERAGRYARWASAHEIGPGDVVCLIMPNCVDYVAIWLGVTSVGGIVAFVNTNLRGPALSHSINAARPVHLIIAANLASDLADVTGTISAPVACWAHGDGATDFPRIDELVRSYGTEALGTLSQHPRPETDRALIIYTSGTTGFPKAAHVSHARILEWSYWFAGMMDAVPSDRLYDCLPLYHSTGGVVAVGAMLVSGGCVVIRSRFSASGFWNDVAETRCTIFQYIGELCRYLVAGPAQAAEQRHCLRLCCGNGLRGDVWQDFEKRFAIPRILEFYAATEGGVSLYNCDARPGSIGRIPAFLAHRFPLALIRCDLETGQPVRDQAGFCVAAEIDEPGEAIGRIDRLSRQPARQFDGYTDPVASEGKIIRNVFADGDAWSRSGDLMRRDAAGYYTFIDRLGDTFRWKGENVSASEVAAAVASCPGIVDCVVYGVAIPGTEGRAGMAAVSTDRSFRLDRLAVHLVSRLPDYARPVFVRLCSTIEMTGTFKLIKGPLARDGYQADVADPIWMYDRASGGFVILDAARLAAFAGGSSSL